VLAATVRVTGDIDVAEECVQDAYARALASWSSDGIPARPGAWLTTVARRRAVDVMRRVSTHGRALPLRVEPVTAPGPEDREPPEIIDDRLRLIFTCCHPAISTDAQVALTLRLLCGLTTAEVARAFLVSEATMAARITRAKKKISAARIPFRVPPVEDLPARIGAVLTVLHLLFSTGHTAPAGADLIRRDLVERSLDLARVLRALLPGDADVAGLLALILLTDARRAARLGDAGQLVLLSDQDRSCWDQDAIKEGISLLGVALQRRPPGRFALMAAIAAVHAQAPSWDATDWREILGLYDILVEIWPSPVVALNRAVAVGLAGGPAAGLAALDALGTEPLLATYSYHASARADFLRKLGRTGEARAAYEEALLLSENEIERGFLADRLHEMEAQHRAGGDGTNPGPSQPRAGRDA
jgi:RNA polymerase sigma-70 factor (ECF subfamily)